MSFDPVFDPRPERYEGSSATSRLGELGLTEGLLHESLRSGDLGARLVSASHPISAAGLRRWMDTAGALRDRLARLGWSADDSHGVARSISEDGATAIIATAGGPATGRLHLPDLQFKRAKGSGTARVVLVNQLELNLDIAPRADGASDAGRPLTWFLLYRCDPGNGEIYAELSRPERIGPDGLAVRWAERIALSPLPSSEPMIVPRDAGDDDGVEFDVEAL